MEVKQVNTSILIITIDYLPEIRFTTSGNRLASIRALGLGFVAFQMWDDAGVKKVDGLADIAPNSTIKVIGTTKVQKYKRRSDGKEVERVIFTIKDWEPAA